MTKKLTITVSDEVYEGLYRRIGRRKISGFLDELARKQFSSSTSGEDWLNATDAEITKGYAEAAADQEAEREAFEWIEAAVDDALDNEDFSDWPGYPSR